MFLILLKVSDNVRPVTEIHKSEPPSFCQDKTFLANLNVKPIKKRLLPNGMLGCHIFIFSLNFSDFR